MRGKTQIYDAVPTASEKQSVRTQIYHGLPAPIQPAPARVELSDGPKTRLLPIEELLKAAKPPPLQGATRATRGWRSRLHRGGSLSRGRKLRLMIGLLSLLVVGYCSLADVSAGTSVARRSEPSVAITPIAPPSPVVAAKEPPAIAVKEAAPKEPKRARGRRREASKEATARRAGDQLAAGELARAAATYEQLAARAPDDPAYAEAARILRLRAAKPAR